MVKPIRLSQLLAQLPGAAQDLPLDKEIEGVVMDSRRIQPGYLFLAIRGGEKDGHNFILDAIQRGAAAVIGEKSASEIPNIDSEIPYIKVNDSRIAASRLSAALYGFPARKLVMIGVTGTDGKTTTSTLIHQILTAAGIRAGMISTVSALINKQSVDTGYHVTTPDAPEIQNLLSQMVSSGLTHVIIEATSHGLAQHRVADCEFDMAVLTNLSHEHLDFHQSFESYRAAKGSLFQNLSSTARKAINPARGAVLNRDDASFSYFSLITSEPVLSYGMQSGADVTALNFLPDGTGFNFVVSGRDLDGENFRFSARSHLMGYFNLQNCLAAVALTRGVMRIDSDAVITGMSGTMVIPGRMEKIKHGQDFTVIVDFAHTPNALNQALLACREITEKRLIVVFGSAGLRDRYKRAMMGKVAARFADLTVLTTEDPRTENPNNILEEIAAGVLSAGGVEGVSFWRIPDRREAIRFAVNLARPGDLVIACGKGHEKSMCIGEEEYPWDDRVALRAAIAEQIGESDQTMPYLPPIES